VASATSIARAGAGFSRKNAKFFAGYAFDAHQVPFAWTPPGRVFVGIDLERTALLGEDGVQEGRGRWGGEALSHKTFRSTKGTDDPMTPLPSDVRSELGSRGDGIAHARRRSRSGRRSRPDGAWTAARSTRRCRPGTLGLAGVGPDAPVALTMDHASAWRARDMVGAMVQGHGSDPRAGRPGLGAKTARALATSIDPEAGALVRIAPARLVWWKGWSSGSLAVA
jgi:hypothetical protein